MNKVKIKHDGKTYFVSPVDDNPHPSNRDSTNHFMYLIEDESEETVGCITFSWSRTARSVAKDMVFRSDPEEEIAYLALMPYLPFYPDLTKKLYTTCFSYIFNTGVEGLAADSSGYSIKVEGGFMRTMQRIIFGGQPTDDQVRKQILLALHNCWLTDPYTAVPLPLVNLFVPVEMQVLVRNILFLTGEKLVDAIMRPHADPPIIETIKITNDGIKHVEDTSEFSVKFSSEIVYQKFMGDNITASSTGSNSPIIIKSQNISVAFEEIEAEVRTTDIANKQEIIVLLDQLKQEVNNKNEPEKVKGLLREIKKKGSWVNDKILSHPLLAQIIAQALMKAAGLT